MDERDQLTQGSPENGNRAEARLAQIEALTDIALAHLDVASLLDELLDRVISILGVDTAAVLLLDRNAEALVATAARGLEEEVRQGVTVPLRQGFAGRIAAEKRPVVLDHVDETTVVNPILIAKGIRAMAGVPLVDAGEVVGVLHVGSLEPRDFNDDDVDLLQLVADRVTGATGSRLVAVERDAALALQRGLLPGRLPEISGLATSARYVPGGGGAVGGDWYDVFHLPSGRVGLVIGDVSGHGLQAAIVMGRVRSALRAYAIQGADPAQVLTRLDAKLQHFEAGEMATVIYGVLDPDFGRLRLACAGHLPPVLVGAGPDPATFVDLAVDPPIGVTSRSTRRSVDLELHPGDLLCFYTDGLIERRGVDLQKGLELLRSTVTTGEPAAVAAEVMSELVGMTVLEDDVALLVVGIGEVGDRHPVELHLPADPTVLSEIRSAVRRWLAGIEATVTDVDELVLAVGEATANAVEHAYGPDGGTIHLRLELEDDRIRATIRDEGGWRGPRGQGRGRGTMLMQAMCDAVDVERSDEGTTVVLHKRLHGGDP